MRTPTWHNELPHWMAPPKSPDTSGFFGGNARNVVHARVEASMPSLRLQFLLGALALSLLLALLNAWALSEYLYWRYIWFDVPMHVLGGLALAAFAVGFLKDFKPRLFLLIITVLIIGWELFELSFGLPREDNYLFDTALDLLMGALGASVIYMLARTTLWKQTVQ